MDHTWSVMPAAIAGVTGRHRRGVPRPRVGSGVGSSWRIEGPYQVMPVVRFAESIVGSTAELWIGGELSTGNSQVVPSYFPQGILRMV